MESTEAHFQELNHIPITDIDFTVAQFSNIINDTDKANIPPDNRKHYNTNYSPDINKMFIECNNLFNTLTPYNHDSRELIQEFNTQINTRLATTRKLDCIYENPK